MHDDGVGSRLRRWRLRRGLTQQVLAELAGFSQAYISRIESGSVGLERPASLRSLARCLDIAVGELTGDVDGGPAYHPVDRDGLEALRAGVAALSCPDVGLHRPGPPLDDVDPRELDRLFDACRYDVLAPAVGAALSALAPAAPAGRSRTVQVCSSAVSLCLELGQADLAVAVANLAMQAARDLGEPAMFGVANYARVRAIAAVVDASAVAAAGIDHLGPYVAGSPEVASVYGMHHLIAAELAARAGRGSDAMAHLAEAGEVAARLGERGGDRFGFGPTNVEFWRLAILVALGDGGAARVTPAGFRVENLPLPHRQATYFIDLSRALLQSRSTDGAAVAALLRAEAIAPQHIQVSDAARTAVRTLLGRPRGSRDRSLRSLSIRVGVG